MRTTTIIPLFVAFGLACSACSKKEETTESQTESAAAEGAEAKPAEDKPAEDKPAEAKEGGGDIGVKECDDYLTKFEGCMKDVPEAGRPAMEQALEQNRKTWKDMASDANMKSALQTACKAALDALAQNPSCK